MGAQHATARGADSVDEEEVDYAAAAEAGRAAWVVSMQRVAVANVLVHACGHHRHGGDPNPSMLAYTVALTGCRAVQHDEGRPGNAVSWSFMEHADAVAALLMDVPFTIDTFALRRLRVPAAGVEHVGFALAEHRQLRRLELTALDMGAEVAAELCAMLRGARRLQRLSLSDNFLDCSGDPEALAALYRLLRALPRSLTHLDVSCNNLTGDAAVACLGAASADVLPNLRKLLMRENRIDVADVDAIVLPALAAAPQLRFVDLRENLIIDSAFESGLDVTGAKDVWRSLTDQLERAAPQATVML
jgi:hypothetical protein